ncbi:MAG: lysophospholipid acyltransferase family protein [Candidatus Omnitrophica bacterium]|nr:lysophospholipid acyltransferase family protein [Candidatus Omnitrophota bacterium]
MSGANKQLKKDLARFSFYFFTSLFKVMPYCFVSFISGALVTIAYWVLKRMRKHAMETLQMAFGHEKSPAELKRICKACFNTLGKGFIELAFFVFHPKMITQKMTFRGNSKENLDAALKEGKGIVAVTAHFGNFSLMFAFLAQMGYPTHAIMRPSRDEKLEQPLEDLRTQVGLKTIYTMPRMQCVSQTIRALRNNEIVLIPMDQNNGSKAGVFVNFFGRPSGTASGPAIFAMRTGSPIVPIFTVRTGKDTHEVMVEPFFYLEKKSTDEETVQYNIQKITTIIETYIRKYPEEWGWMHRRWKSQPKVPQGGSTASVDTSKGDIL